jgi:hypothetical protein
VSAAAWFDTVVQFHDQCPCPWNPTGGCLVLKQFFLRSVNNQFQQIDRLGAGLLSRSGMDVA